MLHNQNSVLGKEMSKPVGVVSIYSNCLTIADVLSQFHEPVIDTVSSSKESLEHREEWARILQSIQGITSSKITRYVNTIGRTVQNIEDLVDIDITSVPKLGYEGQCAAVFLYIKLIGKMFIPKKIQETGSLEESTMFSALLVKDVEYHEAQQLSHWLWDNLRINHIHPINIHAINEMMELISPNEHEKEKLDGMIFLLQQLSVSAKADSKVNQK